MGLKVFVDSDVVISSLLSSNGAAFLLVNQTSDLDLFITNKSREELEKVVERLNMSSEKLNKLLLSRFETVHLNETLAEIKTVFTDYVLDIDDAHIAAGAKEKNVQFLISYNTGHFKTDKIKEDFNIIVTTPANLIQYLRSV